MVVDQEYDADQLMILEGLEAVKKRPGMYIGNTGSSGLHQLVYEIVDNAVDEALEGHCSNIEVTVHRDCSVSVCDDGRGIPVGTNTKAGLSALEVVFTVLHAGGKFNQEGYKISGGLHGVGASVVNALSKKLEVHVWQDGGEYVQFYEYGTPLEPVKRIADSDRTGTFVRFWPDEHTFSNIEWDTKLLERRLHETAYLTSGVTIHFISEIDGVDEIFQEKKGVESFARSLNKGEELLYEKAFYVNTEQDGIAMEVSFIHNQAFSEEIISFVNNIETAEGGTHLAGFKSAYTKAVIYCLGEEKKNKISSEDLWEGFAAVVSIKLPEPQFEGQTKQKLGNRKVRNTVEKCLLEKITVFFELNPDIFNKIVDKAQAAKKTREAVRAARNLVRKKEEVSFLTSVSGKLADCASRESEMNELFLVEGDSAGGSAKEARNRKHQAILPLRGKILNVEKTGMKRVLENLEIQSMIHAIGTGIFENFEYEKLRYHKIIIMTDADVDGAHISTLLLTFFFRYMPKLVENGNIYLAQPPLYMVSYGKEKLYFYDDTKLQEYLSTRDKDKNIRIQRYKGLGEMDKEQLWETTMDPEQRVLHRVNYDPEEYEKMNCIFLKLMGEEVEPRKQFIMERAKYAQNIDV
ncbi:DNA gyrase subunit B [Bacteroides xylanolyticus]|uniref:DNA topoisomerase (ATP-hydrolyzing) n=2 Tax=Lacrimispora defluvii TaxID=2719233 RepID=A0ABX1VLK7_9FIRM|nr:DNA gyrase subunit B [Lacrimispora defluvii]